MNKSTIHNHHFVRRWMTWRGLLALLTGLLSLSASAQQLRVEYYIDHDPGQGKAQMVSVTPDANGEVNFTPATDGLPPGNHILGLRAYMHTDTTSHFAPTLRYDFFVPQQQQPGIVRVEYFWDTDPGLGQATPIDITPANELELNDISIPTDKVPAGAHVLGLRARGTAGWGPTLHQDVYVPAGGASTGITLVEYFWDTDPGHGLGTPLVFTKQNDGTADINTDMPTDGLAPGQHRLGFRAYGSAGWAPTVWKEVVVAPDPANITVLRAEYFWDEDPGYGQGTSFTITSGQTVSVDALGLSIGNLTPGEHQLFVRYQGTNGWSPTLFSDVLVPAVDATISNAEYFWNEDPGYGQGTPINIMSGHTVTLADFGIPSFTVHGDATLFIRYRGTQGWSPTVAYSIMVDAEGNYTLNAKAETSMEQRNYQSLPDMMDDFADRGIGGSITLTVPTTQTVYSLDATDTARLAQIAQTAQDLENHSIPSNHKTLTFTATAGSGNAIAVTANDEDLPTVISLLAQTRLENVALTINGTAYDFTNASYRWEELCAESETTPVGLSAISSAIHATWQAQPHAGTTLSGFPTEGEGDLPSMTIQNNGTNADSLAYTVTLSDTNGRQLYSYLHYIKVHARVSRQSFASLTPVTGSSLDPTVTHLAWSAIDDAAGGYRVVVTESAGGAEPTEIVNTVINSLHYDVNVKSGYAYTWTVTAKGYCDELTSPVQAFTGRLLPDLVVTDIVLPEAAEAGNTITVTATVRNSGEGATKETSWTDRLYYVIDSQNFAQAEQVSTITHHGALDVDESYEVSFTMKVPYLEAGNLRVFIETDAASSVMESNDDNNRTLSNTSATLQPFYMNANDLAALRQLYADFDGANWTGSRWNIASELITENNWSGVTFDTEGQVTAINLQGRGLRGTLNVETVETMQSLTNLDLSHNSIDALTAPLPPSLTNVSLGYQNIEDSVSLSQMLEHSADFTTLLPNITTYNPVGNTFAFNGYFQLTNTRNGNVQSWRMNVSDGKSQQVANPTVVYNEESGHQVRMRVYNGSVWNDMRLNMDYAIGDANLDGLCNVADLQHLINYAVNDTHTRVFFNFKAADLQPDSSANVLDVVRFVNLLLANKNGGMASHRRLSPPQSANLVADAQLVLRSGELLLITSRPVAAFDICLNTSDDAEMQWMPNGGSWQISQHVDESTTNVIVYSLNGCTLPIGETTIALIGSGTVTIDAAMLVDADAAEVSVTTNGIATGISDTKPTDNYTGTYSIDGIKHDVINHKGLYIVKRKKKMVK